jgi:hypothetical protein
MRRRLKASVTPVDGLVGRSMGSSRVAVPAGPERGVRGQQRSGGTFSEISETGPVPSSGMLSSVRAALSSRGKTAR